MEKMTQGTLEPKNNKLELVPERIYNIAYDDEFNLYLSALEEKINAYRRI